MLHGATEHIARLHMIVDVMSDVSALQPTLHCLVVESFHLAVKAVTHEFEGDIGVALDAWRLPLLGEHVEYLVHIGHIEIATQAEVLCPPVIATHEGVHILQTTLASGAVAKVAHV